MIELKNIKKTFDQKSVLKNVSLTIPAGKKVTIIGPSGSGKSTILKLIIGLIHPDSGQIQFNNNDISQMSEERLEHMRENIGLLFQSGALFDSMTIEENVGFSLTENKSTYTQKEIIYKIDHALELVEMSGANKMFPAELSGGQQKRIGLARAIINNPQYILYDEPTTGLDPVLSTNIENLIIRLSDELNSTAIIVTHQISTILRTSDVIYYLDNGVLLDPEYPETIKISTNKTVNNFINGIAS